MTATAQPAGTSRPSRWFAHRGLVRTGLLTTLALVAVSGAGAASAAAAGPLSSARAWPKPWAARFVMPSSGAIVTDGSVPAVVQLAPGVKRMRAWVGERSITGAYRATGHGRVREATLRVGRTPGLGYGPRTLYVETFGAKGREWWAVRHVVITRRGAGLLGRVSARRISGAGAIVTAIAARAGTRVSYRVDGGPRRTMPGSGRRHTVRLNGDAGLGPGPNLITVRGLDAGAGRYETRRVALDLPVDVPIAGAGAARQTPTGRLVRLSAAQTNVPRGCAPGTGGRLCPVPPARMRRCGGRGPLIRDCAPTGSGVMCCG